MKKEKTSEPTDLRILNDRQTAAMLNFTALTLDFSQEGLLEEIISKSNLRTDLFVITVIVKGSITLKINLKEFRLKKNDLLTIPPDSTKETIEISEDAILKVIAYTSGFLLPLNLPDNFWEMTSYFSSENNPVWPIKKEEVATLVALISRMELQEKELSKHPYGRQILNYTFLIFILELAALAKTYSKRSDQRYSRKENLTISFFSLAKKHFTKERSVQSYAQLLFVTPKYLTETIKEISGKTAGEVIDSLVIQSAKIQLSNTSKSISEIASDLNFSDQSFFGKFFKRHTGLSPKEYRASR